MTLSLHHDSPTESSCGATVILTRMINTHISTFLEKKREWLMNLRWMDGWVINNDMDFNLLASNSCIVTVVDLENIVSFCHSSDSASVCVLCSEASRDAAILSGSFVTAMDEDTKINRTLVLWRSCSLFLTLECWSNAYSLLNNAAIFQLFSPQLTCFLAVVRFLFPSVCNVNFPTLYFF